MELIDRDLQMLLVQVEFTLEPHAYFYCNMCCVQLSIVNIIIYLLVS